MVYEITGQFNFGNSERTIHPNECLAGTNCWDFFDPLLWAHNHPIGFGWGLTYTYAVEIGNFRVKTLMEGFLCLLLRLDVTLNISKLFYYSYFR